MLINWNNIRAHGGSQDQGFEELCCQLFHAEPPANSKHFERRGYRDAGLECAYILRDGTLIGMQAKFFTRSPESAEWNQLDKSVATAINKNPQLKRLVICMPQNFDDPKIAAQSSAMSQWKDKVAAWSASADKIGMKVEFDLWDATQLTSRLVTPDSKGRLRYFFELTEFAPEWFSQRIDETACDAGARYTEELNVQLPISRVFEGIGRTPNFMRDFRSAHWKLTYATDRIAAHTHPDELKLGLDNVLRASSEIKKLARFSDPAGSGLLPLAQMSEQAKKIRTECRSTEYALHKIDNDERARKHQEWEASGKPSGYFNYNGPYESLKYNISEAAGAASDLAEFCDSTPAVLANNPVLLIDGAAGKGKTHLLIDAAKRRASQNLPTVVTLGENYKDKDPFAQLVELSGLVAERDEFLQGLSAAAEAAGGRALIMIDALNEGEGNVLWPKRLAGFVAAVRRYPRLGLVLTVRSTYEEYTVPEAVRREAVRVTHVGFASAPEKAMRAFFAHYRIDLPRSPYLHPEYSDPLFLKLLCKGLHAAGLHQLPEGHDGITRVFSFVIDATERKLLTEEKILAPPHQKVVAQFLNALADAMVDADELAVPFGKAYELSEAVYKSHGYPNSLLSLLLSESIISKEMLALDSQPGRTECVTFAYQRFSDFETGRRLLDRGCDPNAPEDCFAPDGLIGKLFTDAYKYYVRAGLLEALSVQVPERFGRELANLLPRPSEQYAQDSYDDVIAKALINSLAWRQKNSIVESTFDSLRAIATTESLYDRYLETLLTLSPLPDHPLNAERLHRMLVDMDTPSRDIFWTSWLHWNYDETGAISRLLAWSLLPDKSHLDDSGIILASTTLAWFTLSTVHKLRDTATKGLVALLTPRPKLVPRLLDMFAGVDDWYATERLYAAAYGVAMRNQNPDQVRDLAVDVHRRLFACSNVPTHVLVRDHGRNVVERALSLGCDLPFDPESARPPYGSVLPDEPPSEEQFKARLPSYDKLTDEDRAFSHVIDRFGTFDVSRHFGGPSYQSLNLSSVLMGEAPPPSQRKQREQWESELNPGQADLWSRMQSIRSAPVQRYYSAMLDPAEESTDSNNAIQLKFTDEETTEYSTIVHELVESLSEDQAERLDSVILADDESKREPLPSLPPDLVARYVSQQALDLGWTAERFAVHDAQVERALSRSSRDAYVETFGAKYLWMAFHLTLGRLVDTYQLFDTYGTADVSPYKGSWQLYLRRVDPSCIPVALDRATKDEVHDEPDAWWKLAAYDMRAASTGAEDWLRETDDLPDAKKPLIVREPSGVEWVVLETFLEYKDRPHEYGDGGPPVRYMWLQLRGYLVKHADVARAYDWLKSQDFMGRWMPEGGSAYSSVFLGEHYNSPAWTDWAATDGSWEYVDWRTPEREGSEVAFAHLTQSYSPPDADTSGCFGASLPAPLLVREAGLRWSGNEASWIDLSNEVVLRAYGDTVMIERNFLDDFLASQGYGLVWTVLGEKQIRADYGERHSRTEISGALLYSSQSVSGEVSAKYVDFNTAT